MNQQFAPHQPAQGFAPQGFAPQPPQGFAPPAQGFVQQGAPGGFAPPPQGFAPPPPQGSFAPPGGPPAGGFYQPPQHAPAPQQQAPLHQAAPAGQGQSGTTHAPRRLNNTGSAGSTAAGDFRGAFGLFKPGIRQLPYNLENMQMLRILPARDPTLLPMDSHYLLSTVPYRIMDGTLGENQLPKFSGWYGMVLAYRFFGRGKENWISPRTLAQFSAPGATEGLDVSDPVHDCARAIKAVKNEGHRYAYLMKGKSKTEQAVLSFPRNIALGNGVVLKNAHDISETGIWTTSGGSIEFTCGELDWLRIADMPVRDPNFPAFQLGDVTDRNTGLCCTKVVRHAQGGSVSDIPSFSWAYKQGDMPYYPHAMWSLSDKHLAQRYDISDIDNVLNIPKYQELLDWLCADGCLPQDLIIEACENKGELKFPNGPTYASAQHVQNPGFQGAGQPYQQPGQGAPSWGSPSGAPAGGFGQQPGQGFAPQQSGFGQPAQSGAPGGFAPQGGQGFAPQGAPGGFAPQQQGFAPQQGGGFAPQQQGFAPQQGGFGQPAGQGFSQPAPGGFGQQSSHVSDYSQEENAYNPGNDQVPMNFAPSPAGDSFASAPPAFVPPNLPASSTATSSGTDPVAHNDAKHFWVRSPEQTQPEPQPVLGAQLRSLPPTHLVAATDNSFPGWKTLAELGYTGSAPAQQAPQQQVFAPPQGGAAQGGFAPQGGQGFAPQQQGFSPPPGGSPGGFAPPQSQGFSPPQGGSSPDAGFAPQQQGFSPQPNQAPPQQQAGHAPSGYHMAAQQPQAGSGSGPLSPEEYELYKNLDDRLVKGLSNDNDEIAQWSALQQRAEANGQSIR